MTYALERKFCTGAENDTLSLCCENGMPKTYFSTKQSPGLKYKNRKYNQPHTYPLIYSVIFHVQPSYKWIKYSTTHNKGNQESTNPESQDTRSPNIPNITHTRNPKYQKSKIPEPKTPTSKQNKTHKHVIPEIQNNRHQKTKSANVKMLNTRNSKYHKPPKPYVQIWIGPPCVKIDENWKWVDLIWLESN